MEPPKNYLSQTVAGTALVIVCLLVLHVIPEFDVGSFHFKRINLLSDVLKKEKPKPVIDTTVVVPVKPVYLDTCKTGLTCIEDYSEDTTGMNIFFDALSTSGKRPVRIAYFADSYVEGDIMLDPFRDSMQALFGGSGVGFVPITSEVATFRQTVTHSFTHWKTYSYIGERNNEQPFGPAGYVFVADTASKVTYKAINRARLNKFPSARVYYGNADSAALIVNDEDTFPLNNSKRLQMLEVKEPFQSFKLSVPYMKSLNLYGVSFESAKGVCVDNFSMRGNSGIGLSYVTAQMYHDFDSLHHYDLVVMAYGLNVASDKAKNYDWYVRSMDQTIKEIRKSFPNSSILLVGCSDRAANVDGDMQTMPMLKEFIEVQRQLAADNNICFWNLFDAMGGDSTMVKWAAEKPPLANKDYTHITSAGGRKVAGMLIGTLLYEKEKYERKKKSRL